MMLCRCSFILARSRCLTAPSAFASQTARPFSAAQAESGLGVDDIFQESSIKSRQRYLEASQELTKLEEEKDKLEKRLKEMSREMWTKRTHLSWLDDWMIGQLMIAKNFHKIKFTSFDYIPVIRWSGLQENKAHFSNSNNDVDSERLIREMLTHFHENNDRYHLDVTKWAQGKIDTTHFNDGWRLRARLGIDSEASEFHKKIEKMISEEYKSGDKDNMSDWWRNELREAGDELRGRFLKLSLKEMKARAMNELTKGLAEKLAGQIETLCGTKPYYFIDRFDNPRVGILVFDPPF